jgi:hypothetical protein
LAAVAKWEVRFLGVRIPQLPAGKNRFALVKGDWNWDWDWD